MQARLNHSKKREAILRMICATRSHPSAERVFMDLKPSFPDLSLGTVYRNIAQLKKSGLLQGVAVVGGQERLDGNTASHVHFICRDCHSVLDLDGQSVPEETFAALNARYGIDIASAQLTYHGRCTQCAKNILLEEKS